MRKMEANAQRKNNLEYVGVLKKKGTGVNDVEISHLEFKK